jgi:hypothetical protein
MEELDRLRPSGSIIAVAAVQLLGSLAVLVLSGLFLVDQLQLYRLRQYPRYYLFSQPALFVVLIVVPIFLCLLGTVTSIGLVRLREWARRVTLYFPTVPLLICALWLVLHHPRDVGGALLVIGDLSNAFAAYLLVILAPISLWWWILFTRKSVRSQFRRNKADT